MADEEQVLTKGQLVGAARQAVQNATGVARSANIVVIPRESVLPMSFSLKRLYPELVEKTPGANQVFLLVNPNKPGANITGYSSGKIVSMRYPSPDLAGITVADTEQGKAFQVSAIKQALRLTDVELADMQLQRDNLVAAAAALGVELDKSGKPK